MQRSRTWLKRLTLLFCLTSLLLWCIKLILLYRPPCKGGGAVEYSTVSLEKWAEQKANKTLELTKWFASQVKTHQQGRTRTSCIASDTSTLLASKLGLNKSLLQLHHRDSSYFATLIAVGDLHLKLGGDGDGRMEPNVSYLLKDISEFITGSDMVVSNLESALEKTAETIEVLRSIQSLGIQLVSLANDPISQQAIKDKVRETTHSLEAAEIKWLGLNAKHHQIVAVEGQRLGFLAFCSVHGQCVHSSSLPFSPLKYSSKVATNAVQELKGHGIEVIIVLMYWGRESSYFPDETQLTIARRLSQLGVSVIIGYHPNPVQDHAYFGNTLVLFSLGSILTSNSITPYCWKKVSDEWKFSASAEHCEVIHPDARQGLFLREQQTRIYRIHLSRSQPVIAEYVTLPLEYTDGQFHHGIKRPVLDHNISGLEWTLVCGETDTHCLACEQF